jgi:S-adenosylmethionine hydrolase
LLLLTFSSDFGSGVYPGICRAVIRTIAPKVDVLDLTHDLPAFDVRAGALVLAEALPHTPVAVHLAVVDPGVGTPRRPVAVRCRRGDLLVGPDNGLLSLAWAALGGAVGAWSLGNPSWRREPVAPTFHGRDIFAPAAAHLAAGSPPQDAGPAVDPPSLEAVAIPEPRVRPGRIEAEVLMFDPFGTARLNVLGDGGLGRGVRGRLRTADAPHGSPSGAVTGGVSATFVRAFAEVEPGEACLLVDSGGWLSLAVNRGSARAALRLEVGTQIEIRWDAVMS